MAETTLELSLAPDAAPALFRHPAIGARPRSASIDWHFYDSTDGALAAAGLALIVEKRRHGGAQRLVRSLPAEHGSWLPAAPMPVLAETLLPDLHPAPALFGPVEGVLPAWTPQGIAAFAGHVRTAHGNEAAPRVTLLAGTLGAVAAERKLARVSIAGESGAVFALAAALARDLPLSVPATSLAEEARGIACGTPPRLLRRGAPEIPRAADAAEAFSAIVAHLTLAMLGEAPAAHAGETPEGVHQTRVALRRLRSALSLFDDIAGGEGKAAAAALKALAGRLGPARDWDVFIGGRLGAVAAAFPGDERIAALLRDAGAIRADTYAALRAALEAPGFRLLGLSLAALARKAHDAAGPADAFAARALTRRLKRVLRHGEDLTVLPVDALHRLRLDAKRLRYAAEMFAPLFGQRKARRFLKALAAVQEELGHLNDAAVAAALLDHLAAPGEGRSFAIGAVEGWIAAKNEGAREAAFAAWEKFLEREVFWDG